MESEKEEIQEESEEEESGPEEDEIELERPSRGIDPVPEESQGVPNVEMFDDTPEYHLVIMGDSGCGKSTLVNFIDTLKYVETMGQTYGYEYRPILLEISNERPRKLHIWDHSGMDKYYAALRIPKRIDAVLIAFDLSLKGAASSCEKWRTKIQKYLDEQGKIIPMIFVGLKSDSELMSEVSEARKYAQLHKATFCEVSAKENTGVQDVIERTIFNIENQERSLILATSMLGSCWPSQCSLL